MRGMGRSVRYWGQKAGYLIGILMLVCAFLFIAMLLLEHDKNSYQIAMRKVLNAYYLTSLMVVMGGQVTSVQVWLGQSLSMGASRKDTILGIQFMSISLAVCNFFVLTILGLIISNQSLFQQEFLLFAQNYFLLILAFAFIGQIMFCVVGKWGKTGYYILVLFCAGTGGIASTVLTQGQSVVVSGVSEIQIMKWVFPVGWVFFGEAMLYLAGFLLQYRFIKKYEVRV